jgi:F-type H+-transporting ATPase subunit b
MKIIISLLIVLVADAHAAGSGGIGGLIWPAVNLTALIALLIYLTRGMIKNYFKNRAQDLSSSIQAAKSKSVEAEEMLKMQKSKINNLDNELKKIETDINNEIKNFEASYKAETEEKIAKLKVDATARIEAEKKQLMSQLNAVLLEEVVNKAKEKVRADSNLSTKATDKLLGELR